MAREADITLDLRGTISSLSLLKVSRAYRDMEPGQVIEIRCTDTQQSRDLLKLLPTARVVGPTSDAEGSPGGGSAPGDREEEQLRLRLIKGIPAAQERGGKAHRQETANHSVDDAGGTRSR